MQRRVLFVTWDGPQVSYLESLYLPIFGALRGHGYRFDVLQFRWGDAGAAAALQSRCEAVGIGYRSVGIRRWPPAVGPFLSALLGGREVRAAFRDFGSDIVMPRSLLPALSMLAARAWRSRPVVFDADGLEADERVEFGGLSPRSPIYRVLRAVEAEAVRRSRAVLVRAPAAIPILEDRAGPRADAPPFFVAPNGRDPALYQPFSEAERHRLRRKFGIAEEVPLLVYLGSVGGKYRVDRVGELMRHMLRLRPDTRLLVLSGSPEAARTQICGADAELVQKSLFARVDAAEVPLHLAACDVGTMFIQPSFSMTTVAPIKLSEYLLCGVPIVGTQAVGDTAPAIAGGVFFSEEQGLEAAATWIVRDVLPARERMRTAARRVGTDHFSFDSTVATFAQALREVS
ncbi:MAG: glycosyltransferase [Allosphingosinicella sp.]|uniref:glycosyltransferase n=1 Tax=Allosphingosinicella sp. TaxID=2823234 RepID=UPI003952395E